MARHLTGDREAVQLVERQNLVVEPVRGLECGEPENLAVELEAVPQYMQRSLEIKLLDESGDEQLLQTIGMQPAHLAPKLRLCRFEESAHPRRK